MTFLEKYHKGETLGNGSYGTVYEARHKENGEIYACKEIVLRDGEISYYYSIWNELVAYTQFNHPHLIKIYNVFTEFSDNTYRFYIIMERCDTSLSYLYTHKKFLQMEEEKKLKYVEQLLSALNYLSCQGYVHNDLSLGNILLKDDQIKIIDFGFIYRKNIINMECHGITIYIQPPELISSTLENSLVEKIDTWSLGIITYMIFYNKYFVCPKLDKHYIDLISKFPLPDFSLLQRYQLAKVYRNFYLKYCVISKNDSARLSFTEENYKNCLESLIDLFPTDSPSLLGNRKIDQFIKGLLIWDNRLRPDIHEAYQLFCSLFEKSNLVVEEYLEEMRSSSFLSLKEETTIQIDLDRYNENIGKILPLLDSRDLFLFHLDDEIYVRANLNVMVQTVDMCSFLSREEKRWNLVFPVERTEVDIPSFLGENFHRIYHFLNLIYNHESDKQMSAYKYYLILSNFSKTKYRPNIWDYYTSRKIPPVYEKIFKFICYVFHCSPYLSLIYIENIWEATIVLMFLHHAELKIFLSEYLKCIKYRSQNYQTPLPNAHKVFKESDSDFRKAISLINANSLTYCYYFLWIFKNIPEVKMTNTFGHFSIPQETIDSFYFLSNYI